MAKEYTPRRASKRWLDGDCPAGVLAIFDHPNAYDRYTVFYKDPVCGSKYSDMHIGYRGMSENPFHPLGFGQAGEMEAHQVADYRYHNKHRAAKWSSLPEAVKKCVRRDLE
jgi:hypothetical protein